MNNARMNGPVIFTTMDFDQPWTLENYLKAGGYQALRKVLTGKMAPEARILAAVEERCRRPGAAGIFPLGFRWKGERFAGLPA